MNSAVVVKMSKEKHNLLSEFLAYSLQTFVNHVFLQIATVLKMDVKKMVTMMNCLLMLWRNFFLEN